MRLPIAFAVVFAASAAAAAPPEPIADAAALPGATYRAIHDDAALRVLVHKLDAGASDPFHAHPCSVNYALGPFTVTNTSASGFQSDARRAFRGAWSRPAEAHATRNPGPQPARHLTIELKAQLPGVRGCGPEATAPAPALAADHATRAAGAFYKVVLDNAALRVIESNVPARATVPPHALGCGVTIALTPQTLRIVRADGTIADHEHAPSTAWWRPAGAQAIANLGAQNAFSLLVEFKTPVEGAVGCAAPVAP